MKSIKAPTSQSSALDTTFVKEIRSLITEARSAVVKNVDYIQVHTCFEIGRRIINHEQKGESRAEYGKTLLIDLSERLTEEFGKGFSRSNLQNMRNFYLIYSDRLKKCQMPSGKFDKSVFSLNWSQYIFLIGIKGDDERLALSRDKEGVRKLAKEGQIIEKPQDLLKNPYILEFVGLDGSRKYSESDLESALIDKLEHFLLELGKGFLFEARQKRFTFDEDHFFVDLVFYNRLLNAYVLIDLKMDKLTHQDLGQMQMYVNYFDRYVKKQEEGRTIGIILCPKNREALVEITLPKDANIHAKEYRLYLPSKGELKRKLLDWTNNKNILR